MSGRMAFHREDTAKSLRMGSGTETRGTAGIIVLPQVERWGTVGARLEKGAGDQGEGLLNSIPWVSCRVLNRGVIFLCTTSKDHSLTHIVPSCLCLLKSF